MKKIMISLLMIAATLNAMAITYTGKVQVVLRATSNNAACAAVIATSDALNDGLNPTYYAELNDEGKEVLAYVEYNNVRYEHFGSSSSTMQNMPLIMKANASAQYRMNFYEMEGTIEIYDVVAGANIDKSQPYIFTIEDAQKNTIIADRFIINYVAPVTGYNVTLNGAGLATFSADGDDATIPDGVEAYTATYQDATQEIVLNKINATAIPAGVGVILYGTPGAVTLPYTTGADALTADNDLYPATAWATADKNNVFVLSGNQMFKYVGTDPVPANKAFMKLPGGANNAPARISMRFNTTTAVENVETEAVQPVKFIENGEIFIRRGNEVYNLQGQLVK